MLRALLQVSLFYAQSLYSSLTRRCRQVLIQNGEAPGWVLLDADMIEMVALQMKKIPVQVQQQYKVSNLNKYIFDVQYNDRFNTATFLCP
jgi:hypothetical protein